MDLIQYFNRPHPHFAREDRLKCPGCGRKGAVRTVEETRVLIGHTCPGPWLLEGTESDSHPNYRLTFYGDAARAALAPYAVSPEES